MSTSQWLQDTLRSKKDNAIAVNDFLAALFWDLLARPCAYMESSGKDPGAEQS